ncbi:MAG TPA: NUDIX domain-containing protein [Streptomyces sp.]
MSSSANPRRAVRALVLDGADRILLCGMAVPEPPGTLVWAAPGGGIEPGERPLDALRRELREEVGLVLPPTADPPHVWHQEVLTPGHPPGHDGVSNDYFLVRTAWFTPRGELSTAALEAENITGSRWWRLPEIAAYDGPDLFSPRDLATPLAALIATGPPDAPVALSW